MAHYITTAAAIDAALVADSNTLLLIPFDAGYADFDAVRVHWSVYIPPVRVHNVSSGPRPRVFLDQPPSGYFRRSTII